MYQNYGNFPMPWPQYQPTRPMLPQQQIVQVAGPDSLAQIQMAPNSSMLVMHQTEAIVYMGVTDGAGKASWTAYDYTPHKDPAQVQQESMAERLAAVEAAVKRLEGVKHEPDDAVAS